MIAHAKREWTRREAGATGVGRRHGGTSCIAVLWLATIGFAFPFSARAADTVPAKPLTAAATQTEAGAESSPVRATTDDGVPLAELIDVQVRNVRLRIPAGYLAPWPTQTMRGTLNVVDSLNLNFWMLARRYPEIDSLLLKYERRSKGAGRAEPPLYAGGAQVRGLQLVVRGASRYASPDARLENTSRIAELFESQEFGLAIFRPNNAKRPLFFTEYHRQGGGPQALMRRTLDTAVVASSEIDLDPHASSRAGPIIAQNLAQAFGSPPNDSNDPLWQHFNDALRVVNDIRKTDRSTVLDLTKYFREFGAEKTIEPYLPIFRKVGVAVNRDSLNQRHYVYIKLEHPILWRLGFVNFAWGDRLVMSFTTPSESSNVVIDFEVALLNDG